MRDYSFRSISTDEINEAATKWGDSDTCLLYYYFPVVEITVTIVWIVFILISRREGEQRAYTYVQVQLN